jgi:hypothetical protein
MLSFVVFGLVAVALLVGTVRWARKENWGSGSGDYPYYANPGTLEEAERTKPASEHTYERNETFPRANRELTEAHRKRPTPHTAADSLSQ